MGNLSLQRPNAINWRTRAPSIAPPDFEFLNLHGVDVEKIEWDFRKIRVTARDAFISPRDSTIRLANLLDSLTWKQRRKLTANQYRTEIENRHDSKNYEQIRIPKIELVTHFKSLNFKAERAVGGRAICKKPLLDVILQFDEHLNQVGEKRWRDFEYPYRDISKRSRLIAEWVNWFFKIKYGIESTYKAEQIRKLLTRKRTQKQNWATGILPNPNQIVLVRISISSIQRRRNGSKRVF